MSAHSNVNFGSILLKNSVRSERPIFQVPLVRACWRDRDMGDHTNSRKNRHRSSYWLWACGKDSVFAAVQISSFSTASVTKRNTRGQQITSAWALGDPSPSGEIGREGPRTDSCTTTDSRKFICVNLISSSTGRRWFEIGSQACSSSSNALACFKSSVSKPSVNQPYTGARRSCACCRLP
jgi:hypothetical protein